MIKSCKKPPVYFESTTGSFYSQYAGLPLKSCVSQIQGYQEGSGTPSPSNIRNLVSFNSATLTENGNTHLFAFGTDIYSGSIDWKKGIVIGTYKIVDLGDLEWKYTSVTTRFYTDDITDISLDANFTDMLCSNYDVISSSISFSNMPDKSIKRGQSSTQISIRDLDYTDTDIFKNAISGVQLAYELATPIEIPLGGIQLLTQQGLNSYSADCGNTAVEYLKAGR